MKAKEKAEELVKMFGKYSFSTVDINQDKENAKDLALLCVNEIIEAFVGTYETEYDKEFWQDVKKEIELL